MNTKKTFFLAWSVCGIIILGTLFGMGRDLLNGDAQRSTLLVDIVFPDLIPIVFVIVGALIVSRQPRNVIGWLVMTPAFTLVFSDLLTSMLRSILVHPAEPSIFLVFIIWFTDASWVGFIFPLFFIALLFPTGMPVSPFFRWVVVYGIGLVVFFLLISLFAQTYTLDEATYGINWSFRNPIGFITQSTFDSIFALWWDLALAVLTVLSLFSLVVRYWQAAVVERDQIKWILFACGIFALIYLASLPTQTIEQGVLRDVLNLLFFVGILGIPIAIGIAILRYNLYDINIIIRKTLVFSILTALLGLIYFGSVLLLQVVFRKVTGNTSPIAIVLSTLVIAALFSPLRTRLQDFIDRRFYRRKYDAVRALASFNAVARDEVELGNLTDRLLSVARETMQPVSISLWLKPKATEKQYKNADSNGVE